LGVDRLSAELERRALRGRRGNPAAPGLHRPDGAGNMLA
jgi:hypothetical protein